MSYIQDSNVETLIKLPLFDTRNEQKNRGEAWWNVPGHVSVKALLFSKHPVEGQPLLCLQHPGGALP